MAFDVDRDEAWEPLVKAALAVRGQAYAPYSKYHVGAALQLRDGTVGVGCNVENGSFGATVCAERNAVFSAVARGHRSFEALVVATAGEEPGAPCGMCLQVLVEFADELPILLVSATHGVRVRTDLRRLLPSAFRLQK